ncbi:MAG: hypothetical protein ACR2IJ_06465 [Fluviibacter sp.]
MTDEQFAHHSKCDGELFDFMCLGCEQARQMELMGEIERLREACKNAKDYISVRDYFAAKALPALIKMHPADMARDQIGLKAYAIADRMIAARAALREEKRCRSSLTSIKIASSYPMTMMFGLGNSQVC